MSELYNTHVIYVLQHYLAPSAVPMTKPLPFLLSSSIYFNIAKCKLKETLSIFNKLLAVFMRHMIDLEVHTGINGKVDTS